MNHRDRDAHRCGFTCSNGMGYRPPVRSTLWQSMAGKAILVIAGSVFILTLAKALL